MTSLLIWATRAFSTALLLLPVAAHAWPKDLINGLQERVRVRSENGAIKLFHVQIERLVQLRYPQAMHIEPEQFRAMLAPLSAQLSGATRKSKRGNIPFLIVIPPSTLSIGTEFDLLEVVKDKRGSALYRPTSGIIDTVTTPSEPYLIFDVDSGVNPTAAHPFKSAGEARRLLAEHGRRGLTMSEAISLLTQFSRIARKSAVYATASSWPHDGTEVIPRITNASGYPLLTYLEAEYFRRNSLPASCRKANYDN